MAENKSLEQIVMEGIELCTHTRCKKCDYYGDESAYAHKGECRGRMIADLLRKNGVVGFWPQTNMDKFENLRFEVMVSRDYVSMLCDPLFALTIKGEIDGKTYGSCVHLPSAYGEVPAGEFMMAVNTLQETMGQIAEELQKDGEGE